ncbi:5-(carboxyamino)imidazole ribonucleotide synthase [Crinalium epipsammum PCC 9333]|uniref:N5-carboxyaminoimidazole ribonucleotide synthase n=1 Tax=Crinalium epipsammum PCC 9333 TaxID=1173022 RepID=K9W466_9CYAN|nr:5-(carboxyamino)imidazole ribonucleotide synthase [Crinalium epipsammum]AFZ15006.1 5-(carboxyamino)imidazole ribonucleotide synthase [Crinalium epipsammum PCC 9333]
MKRIGVIGGGQLAWMMADAVKKLGIELIVQTPHATDPAVAIATDTILAAVADATATAQLATRCDVITFENEFIEIDALTLLADERVCFRPQLKALAPLLDKYEQRCYLNQLGLPVPKFAALEDSNSQEILTQTPIVLKARRHGYDGQGTFIIKDQNSLKTKLEQLQQTPLLVEEFVPFERELAVIAARSVAGEVVVYPVVETQQEDQVCRRVIVPAEINSKLATEIEAIAHTLLNSLQVVGLFGIELFLTRTGKILINEIAPRTHNSGHFTLDACETSQFEQQLRAVAGLPLGNTALKCQGAVMVNLLGYEHSQSDYTEKRQQLAALPETYVHWYGKTESRPGRKLGHVTVLLDSDNRSEAEAIAQKVEYIWYSS